MMTAETKVKKIVSTYLETLEIELDKVNLGVYKVMFVPVGYGKRNQLDFTLCLFGQFVAIETKAGKNWLTPLQRVTCRSILQAGGKVFIVSGGEGLDAFKNWVSKTMQGFVAPSK